MTQILDKCDFITASKNKDATFRIAATAKAKQEDGKEVDVIVQIERAIIRIEALSTGEDVFQVIFPDENASAECSVEIIPYVPSETRGDT